MPATLVMLNSRKYESNPESLLGRANRGSPIVHRSACRGTTQDEGAVLALTINQRPFLSVGYPAIAPGGRPFAFGPGMRRGTGGAEARNEPGRGGRDII